MANDIKLQESHPVDENIRPIKVGGVVSSLEISKTGSGAKVTGDLECTGTINGKMNVAGTIIGYTAIGADAGPAYFAVTNTWTVISDDHKVQFTVPIGGKVEIEASCVMDVVGGSARPLYLGLSSASATTGYSALDTQHEQLVCQVDETDTITVNTKWVLEGLGVGSTGDIYIGTKSSHSSNMRLYWGGDSTEEYPPFIIKATALPVGIYDG